MNLPGPWNIDNYGKDDSLEECVAETPSSNSNMMVGKVTFKIVTPSETLNQRRPSPVPGPSHQTIPNIHGIQHRQQAPGQFSQMTYLRQQQQFVQASIRRPGGLCRLSLIWSNSKTKLMRLRRLTDSLVSVRDFSVKDSSVASANLVSTSEGLISAMSTSASGTPISPTFPRPLRGGGALTVRHRRS